MADKMEIVERTEPITIEEVFDFIDDTSIGKMDAHELKSRIANMTQEVRAKAFDELMEVVKSTYHNFCGFDLGRMTKYGNEDAGQQEQSYSTMMMYEISYEFEDLIDALEQLKEGGKE